MTDECCKNINLSKDEKEIPENLDHIFTSLTKSGKIWVPMYLISVDPKKCIGCGKCVQICMGKCYRIKNIEPEKRNVVINGIERMITVKRVAEVVSTDSCYGDCHCHLICPIKDAIICKTKTIYEFN